MNAATPRIGFILEQTLGHVTHGANLRALIPSDDRIRAVFVPIEFAASGIAGRIPGYRNWTVRAGVHARRKLRGLRRDGVDALFVHTQVPAVLLLEQMRRLPTVVSLDATPLQYDEVGTPYGHSQGGRRVEQLKWRLNRACFHRAAALVTWTEHAKRGLVDGYDVDADQITVIPPGVDVGRWTDESKLDRRATDGSDRPTRVLFVGADFERKGGAILISAIARLRDAGISVEADVATRDEVPTQPGVRVHHGVGPNSQQLIELYRAADIFCLPTFADMLPMVLSEAAVVGLPLVSTDVGAISEVVRPQRTGLLVPSGDPSALADAIARLAANPDLRRRLGEEARRFALAELNAEVNARRLVDVLLSVVAPLRG